jgi:hypothetical protein
MEKEELRVLEQRTEWPPLQTAGTPWSMGLQSLIENVLSCKQYAHFVRYVRQVLNRLDVLHAEGHLVPVELPVRPTGWQPGECVYAVVGGLQIFGIDISFLRRDWGMTMGVHLYTAMEAAQVAKRITQAVPTLQFETGDFTNFHAYSAQRPIPEYASKEEPYPQYYAILVLAGEPEANTHIACYPWSDAPMR